MNSVAGALLLSLLLLPACGRDADPTSPAASTPQGPTIPSPANSEADKPAIVFLGAEGEIRIGVEVVSTPAKIQRGLMHRRHLAPNRGMLFVFSTERVRSFWMKNTLIPLDMLFVKEDMSIAGIERDTVPLSLASRSVNIPTRYVIEVNGGWTAKHGIEVGSSVRLENLPTFEAPPP